MPDVHSTTVANPEITFGEVFGHLMSVIWNCLLVVIALASFAQAETRFQTLTFCFLLIIYIRLTFFIEATDAAAIDARESMSDAFMRVRVVLNDVTLEEKRTYEQQQAVGWESNDRLRKKRQRTVRLLIRGLFSLVLFIIAAWHLVTALLS